MLFASNSRFVDAPKFSWFNFNYQIFIVVLLLIFMLRCLSRQIFSYFAYLYIDKQWKFTCTDWFTDIIQIIDSISFKLSEEFKNCFRFLFAERIDHKTRIVFISMFQFDSIPIFISHLIHIKSINTYYICRYFSWIVILCNDQNISN